MFYGSLGAFLVLALVIGFTKQGRKAARVFANKDDGQTYRD